MAETQEERFGDRLRRHREAAGYSQEELAERAGLSANAISALERGERKRPYPDTLRRLAKALGLGDDERSQLVAALPAATGETRSPARGASRRPHPASPLPGEPTPLIGREREIDVVRYLLANSDGRLLTLIGTGGVGKTRIALHVARSETDRYPDGVAWVELAPLGDPELVQQTIALATGLDTPLGADPGAALRTWLRDRRLLLVLDNFEHLPDAAPDLARLLHDCTGVRILVTSRSPLRIRGEQEYIVPPLELPPAGPLRETRDVASVASVQFFVWQAMQKNPAFALTDENVPIVAAICRRLDGLPLALELVAARVRVLSPSEVLARLDRLMPLLVGGSRDLPHRQQTMRATINWSYELLRPAEQALFRRLSVFAGGWRLDAAGAIAPGGDEDAVEMVDRLGALVEQSLVTVSQAGPETRYAMLEPIRQFARERLDDLDEAPETWRRHASHTVAIAERAALELEGRSDQVAWLDRLEREHDNLRAVLAWAADADEGAEPGLRLASALWRFWEVRGHTAEGVRWLDAALARDDPLPPLLRARALTAAGNLARDLADFQRATGYHERGLAIWRRLGDTRGIASSLNNLGVISRDRGDTALTLRLCQESLDLFREAGDDHGAAIALISLGMASSLQGDNNAARVSYAESLAFFRTSGDRWHTAWVLSYLAQHTARQGDAAETRAIAEESLALHRTTRDSWGIATALEILGNLDQEEDLESAARQFAEGFCLLVDAGVERAIPASLENLAGVEAARGQLDRAARLAGAASMLRDMRGATYAVDQGSATEAILADLRTGPSADAWAEGRALTRERAIDEALALAEDIGQGAARQIPEPPDAIIEPAPA